MFRGRRWIGVAINAVILIGGPSALVAELVIHGFSEPWWLAFAFLLALPGLLFLFVAWFALGTSAKLWHGVYKYLDAFRFSLPVGIGLAVRFLVQKRVDAPVPIG